MNGLLVRENEPSGPGRRSATQAQNAGRTAAEEHQTLLCRRCGQRVTDRSALFCMGSDSVSRVFPNAHGLLREILTALRAEGLRLQGPATTDFTWFPGYAWEVAYCGTCGAHLGWLFTATGNDEEPQSFWGLLREALAGRGA